MILRLIPLIILWENLINFRIQFFKELYDLLVTFRDFFSSMTDTSNSCNNIEHFWKFKYLDSKYIKYGKYLQHRPKDLNVRFQELFYTPN